MAPEKNGRVFWTQFQGGGKLVSAETLTFIISCSPADIPSVPASMHTPPPGCWESKGRCNHFPLSSSENIMTLYSENWRWLLLNMFCLSSSAFVFHRAFGRQCLCPLRQVYWKDWRPWVRERLQGGKIECIAHFTSCLHTVNPWAYDCVWNRQLKQHAFIENQSQKLSDY